MEADHATINDVLEDGAYVVIGDAVNYPQKITVKSKSDKFIKWEGIDEGQLLDGTKLTDSEISFNMPEHDLTLTAVETKTDLAASITNGKPTQPGSKYNGWKWDGTTTLTIYAGNAFDLTGVSLNCKVVNYGNLTGGTYNDTVTNDGGTIKEAEFNKTVINKNVGKLTGCVFHYGTTNGTASDTVKCMIENSRFENPSNSSNYSIVNNGIFENNDNTASRYAMITNNATGEIISGTYANYLKSSGTIKDGTYTGSFVNNGIIEQGNFKDITNDKNGIIRGGIFTGATQKNNAGATIEGGIFTKLTKANNNGTINGGIFANNLEIDGQHKITAPDCTINDKISNAAYVVGNQELVITTKAWKFKEWDATGIDLTQCKSVKDEHTVTLTIDLSNVQADDEITLKRIIEKTELSLDGNDLPEAPDEDGNRYTGSSYDGWKYAETKNAAGEVTRRTLTLYNNYPINFAGHEIDWTINNNGNDLTGGVLGGIIEDGTFTGPITNANTIKNGQFTGAVTNTGTIENGVYLNSVSNYGLVKDGTYAGRFVNGTRTTQDADGNEIYSDGYVESGVFSRYADFGNQAEVMPIDGEGGFSIQWIKLNGATVNDAITEQAGVVGKQTIKVTVDNPSTFDHWSIGGDADLTEIKAQLDGHLHDTTLSLDLDGADGGMILLTAETSALPGKLSADDFKFKTPENLTADGTAKNATVTAEKSGVGEITLCYYDAEGNLLASAPTKAGTYTVGIRVAATDDYEAASLTSEDWTFTVAEKTYKITVVNGESNMTTAAAGAKVTITAKDAPAGQKFSKWTSDAADTLFVEKTDTKTSFLMPEGDIVITAVYEKLPEEKPEETPSDKPAEKPEETPSDKPTEKPEETPSDKPTEKPEEIPSDKPEEKPEPKPEVKIYSIHVFDGETEVNGALVSESKAGETVTVRLLPEAIPAGQEFDHWEALPESLELKDACATETTFVMPEEAVTLRAAYRDVVVAPQKVNPVSAALGAAVVGTGVVLTGWTVYNIGTELYAKWVLPAGAQMPSTRGELAVLLWQTAGSPEVAIAGKPLTDLEQAERWVVDNGLMTEKKDSGFGADDKVGKLEVFMALNNVKSLSK